MVGVHPQAPDAAVVAAAASVAAACQVPLRLACVAESDGDQPLARAAIDSLMQLARRVHADVQGEVLAGHAAPALLSAASQRGTDLLVVSRERPGQRPAAGGRARLGSTAQAVTGQAGGPVLVHVASGST
jgi:nucleotide-binding universal stress UspA family protein